MTRQGHHAKYVVLDEVELPFEIRHVDLLQSVTNFLGLAAHVSARRLWSIARRFTAVMSHDGVRGNPAVGPFFQRCNKGVLRDVFGKVDVAGHAGQRRHEARRLGTPRGGHCLSAGRAGISRTGGHRDIKNTFPNRGALDQMQFDPGLPTPASAAGGAR